MAPQIELHAFATRPLPIHTWVTELYRFDQAYLDMLEGLDQSSWIRGTGELLFRGAHADDLGHALSRGNTGVERWAWMARNLREAGEYPLDRDGEPLPAQLDRVVLAYSRFALQLDENGDNLTRAAKWFFRGDPFEALAGVLVVGDDGKRLLELAGAAAATSRREWR